MNRSSPRPSSRSAVISPSVDIGRDCSDSTLVVPPTSAFFSITDRTTSSAGPTCATVTGPVGVAAKASWRSGRLRSGSSDQRRADDADAASRSGARP